jgi:hypothetical protein
MSLYMYKRIKGELERETVRPVAYQGKLADGWVVDPKDLIEPVKETPKKKTKVKYDNKD